MKKKCVVLFFGLFIVLTNGQGFFPFGRIGSNIPNIGGGLQSALNPFNNIQQQQQQQQPVGSRRQEYNPQEEIYGNEPNNQGGIGGGLNQFLGPLNFQNSGAQVLNQVLNNRGGENLNPLNILNPDNLGIPLISRSALGNLFSNFLKNHANKLYDLSFDFLHTDTNLVWNTYKSFYENDFGVSLTDLNREVFSGNLGIIHSHNKRFLNNAALYTMQLYEYSHLPFEDFLKIRTGVFIDEDQTLQYQREIFGEIDFSQFDRDFEFYIKNRRFKRQSVGDDYSASNSKKSSSQTEDVRFDWNERGHVTPVEDQGSCGSCWAFATTSALESQYSIKYGLKYNLSEQQLISCDNRNMGCNGGNPYNAFITIFKDKITFAPNYPFVGESDDGCIYNKDSFPTVECKGYNYKRYKLNGDEEALKWIVETKGPVAATLRVSRNFEFYKSGIFIDDDCEGPMNHAVLITGFGTENGTDYWILKNSWSTNWGENGYIRFARNNNNMCGIAFYGAVPYV